MCAVGACCVCVLCCVCAVWTGRSSTSCLTLMTTKNFEKESRKQTIAISMGTCHNASTAAGWLLPLLLRERQVMKHTCRIGGCGVCCVYCVYFAWVLGVLDRREMTLCLALALG